MREQLHIAVRDSHTYVRVKSWLAQRLGAGSTVSLAGAQLPTTGSTVSTRGSSGPGLTRILCLGPSDWLLISTIRSPAQSPGNIANDLPDAFTAIDLSDSLTTIEIQGSEARELLSKGCGLDLHPEGFQDGQCARTRFAQIPVVIDCVDPMPLFELHVSRSYFAYLYSWLLDAAIEFETVAPTA